LLPAEKITEAKLVEIEAVLREAEPLETASAEKLLAVGDRFHALVDQASRNTTLLRFVDTVEALDPIDRLELLRKPEQARESFREHREIAAALASRDRDLAESLMRLHVLRSGHSIFKTLPDV
jgi:DNA-binding GntR family transcriptional regulator